LILGYGGASMDYLAPVAGLYAKARPDARIVMTTGAGVFGLAPDPDRLPPQFEELYAEIAAHIVSRRGGLMTAGTFPIGTRSRC